LIGMFGLTRAGKPSAVDKSLARLVRSRLLNAGCDFGKGYTVYVKDRIAIIKGTMDSLWKIREADAILRETPGLKGIASKGLAVSGHQVNDREIASATRKLIKGVSAVDERTLAVSVKDGVVTLAGTSPSAAETQRILGLIEHLRGVRKVRNLTTVGAEQARADRNVARSLSKAIGVTFPASRIEVSVFGGVAVLSGKAGSAISHTGIRRLAARHDGVFRVVDKMRA
jgi:osmotically-inducible protein OsmY